MDEGVVEILIRAKEMGLEAIRNVKEQITELRSAVERSMAAMAGSTPVTDEYGKANKGASREVDDLRQAVEKYASITGGSAPIIWANIEATIRSKAAYNDLKDAIRDYTASQGMANAAAVAGAAANAANAASTSSAASAATAASGSFLGMGVGAWVAVAAVVVLVAVLAPFILLLVGAVTIVTAFVVGLTAVAISLGLVAGLMGALSVATVLLADHLFQLGLIKDPLLGLEDHLRRVVNTWAREALPMAKEIISWLDSMVGIAQRAGTSLLEWFGPRLPAFLGAGTAAVNAMSQAINDLAAGVAPLVDEMLKNAPVWEQWFNILAQAGVQAMLGLLTNLLALSNWFLERAPAMGPIVAEIGSAVGTFVQGALSALGRFVDWFIAHWPEIKRHAEETWKAIKEGWDNVKPAIDGALDLFKQLLPVWEYVKGHGQDVHDMLVVLGVAMGLVVAAAIVMVGVALLIIAAFIWLHDTTQAVARAVGDFFYWLGQLWGIMSSAAGALSPFIGGLEVVLGLLERIIQATYIWKALAGGGGGGGAPNHGIQGEHGLYGAGSPASQLGSYQAGGVVPGPIGAAQLAIVHGGETVLPVGGGGTTMDDTNEILVAIYQVLNTRLQPGGFSTAAYGRA